MFAYATGCDALVTSSVLVPSSKARSPDRSVRSLLVAMPFVPFVASSCSKSKKERSKGLKVKGEATKTFSSAVWRGDVAPQKLELKCSPRLLFSFSFPCRERRKLLHTPLRSRQRTTRNCMLVVPMVKCPSFHRSVHITGQANGQYWHVKSPEHVCKSNDRKKMQEGNMGEMLHQQNG